MVVLLVAMLSVLADSREHIVAQDRKINRIVKGTDPILNEVEPVAADAGRLVDQATPFVRDLRATMIPLVRELGATLPPLLREFDTGALFEFVDLGTDLVEGLRDSAFIPRTLLAADLVPEMRNILAETLQIQRATLSTQLRSYRVQRKSRRVQKVSLDIQRRTLALLTRSLSVQEEALVHVRSIDQKTGGPAPTTAPTPTPVPQR